MIQRIAAPCPGGPATGPTPARAPAVPARLAPLARLRRLALLLAFGLCLPLAGHAQQYAFRYFGPPEGLGDLSITALAQDRDGYIWIGTDGGLYRYDGASFEHVAGMGGRLVRGIRTLHVDPRGDVWVGTDSGLFHTHDGQAWPVALGGPVAGVASLASDGADRLLAVVGERLFAIHRGPDGGWRAAPYFDDAALASYPELRIVRHLEAARDGAFWLTCTRTLCRLRDGHVDVIDAPRAALYSWSNVIEDGHGDLWLRGASRILQRPQGAAAFVDRTGRGLSRGGEMADSPAVIDPEGRLVTSWGTGIARWDGTRWEHTDAANGLVTAGGVQALLFDREGNLWVGTAGRGLAQWRGYGHLSAWTTKEGLPDDDVWSFVRDRHGALHVGSARGFSVLPPDGRRFTLEERPTELQPANSIAEDGNGAIWMGLFSGQVIGVDRAARWRTTLGRFVTVNRVFSDSAGRVWICTQYGLFVVDPAHGDRRPRRVDAELYPTPKSGPRYLSGCESPTGTIWFTSADGVLRWDAGRLATVPLRPVGAVALPENGFPVVACSASGDLWLSNPQEGGLWRLHPAGDAAEVMLATPDVLADRNIVSLHEDRRGWLWIGTNAGVSVWNKNRRRSFTQDNGLVWNDCNEYALAEDADGSMWVGTGAGAQHIANVESIFEAPPVAAPRVSLEQGERPVAAAARVALPWAHGALRANFSSPSYESRRFTRYRYRLVGLDDTWSTSAAPEVTFSTLAPGRYRLEVMTLNAALDLRSPVATLDIDVLPPWWRTPAFDAACVLAAALLAWSLHAWRLRAHARRQAFLEGLVADRTAELERSREAMRMLGVHNVRTLEEERTRVSRELHDEMGQQLAALRMEVSVLRKDLPPVAPGGRGPVEMLLGRVNDIVASMRSVVTQLRPPALDGGLGPAIDWLAAEFTRHTGVPCRPQVHPDVRMLAPEAATMVFRIVQESLNNVRRHSGATRVTVALQPAGDSLELLVSDDGAGFQVDARREGYGLLGMEERARALGGRLVIDSAPGAGTTIRLAFAAVLPGQVTSD